MFRLRNTGVIPYRSITGGVSGFPSAVTFFKWGKIEMMQPVCNANGFRSGDGIVRVKCLRLTRDDMLTCGE